MLTEARSVIEGTHINCIKMSGGTIMEVICDGNCEHQSTSAESQDSDIRICP
jgi:hypothetical protein